MSPDERSAYLANAERNLEKCRDLATRSGEVHAWSGDEARKQVRQQRIVDSTESLLCAMFALGDRLGDSDCHADCVITELRTQIPHEYRGHAGPSRLDLVRFGATRRVIGPVRAPSTLGIFLRSFIHGHVLQVAKANRTLLARRASPLRGNDGLVMADTIGGVHGPQEADRCSDTQACVTSMP